MQVERGRQVGGEICRERERLTVRVIKRQGGRHDGRESGRWTGTQSGRQVGS